MHPQQEQAQHLLHDDHNPEEGQEEQVFVEPYNFILDPKPNPQHLVFECVFHDQVNVELVDVDQVNVELVDDELVDDELVDDELVDDGKYT